MVHSAMKFPCGVSEYSRFGISPFNAQESGSNAVTSTASTETNFKRILFICPTF